MTEIQQRRFLIALLCFGCFLGMMKLLLDEDMAGFWIILSSFAYIMFDRVFERKDDKLMDKRLRNSEPANMFDYRRAKLLLDVLAMDEIDVEILKYLCKSWGVVIVYEHGASSDFHSLYRPVDVQKTIQALAKYVLSHGRNEVTERQADEP